MANLKNKYCSLAQLRNEASVEACFMEPLLRDLGYENDDIAFKTSISELAVNVGSKRVLYKPDYVLMTKGIPTVVVDAKSPEEELEAWEPQCSSYCLELNKQFDYNPVQLYVLSNGVSLRMYQWDLRKPLLVLDFADFVADHQKFKSLISMLGRKFTEAKSKQTRAEIDSSAFTLSTLSLRELAQKFQKMHKTIWRTEKKGPSAAFEELMKIIFVKIQKDRQLHEKLGPDPKPAYKDVVFSLHWISGQTENESPINDPLFKNLVTLQEADISRGTRKRIFDRDEQINISSETIKKIVKEIEHLDFFAMEEDIHGRMFEAFLDATVRGKDIGQFFTPRDIVDLMVALADPVVKMDRIDTVLDACCGSGGFLISSMRRMLRKADQLKGLTSAERAKIVRRVKNERLFGIDAGSDPAMYRIARMNMYLHGDGGSNIFYADSLDKRIGKVGRATVETDQQLDEIRKLLFADQLKFDLILSNPPFSLEYSRDDSGQAEILNQYQMSLIEPVDAS